MGPATQPPSDRPGARGARAGRRGDDERGDRARSLGGTEHRAEAPRERLREAGRQQPHRGDCAGAPRSGSDEGLARHCEAVGCDADSRHAVPADDRRAGERAGRRAVAEAAQNRGRAIPPRQSLDDGRAARPQSHGADRAEAGAHDGAPFELARSRGVRRAERGRGRGGAGTGDQSRAESSRDQGDDEDERTAHPVVQRVKGQNGSVRVSAKADYAIRAGVELAAAGEGPLKGDRIAQAQQIPANFLENILSDLRNAGLVSSRRGAEGGYWLARPAAEISLADVIRAVDGPPAHVRGVRSEQVEYVGNAQPLRDVWVAVRASLRSVLEGVSLADLAAGDLPASVQALAADPDAWAPH